MRGENHFRVKGENIGQPEVIFRKISFFVTVKHAEKGENDFLKSFSPKTNAPLVINAFTFYQKEKKKKITFSTQKKFYFFYPKKKMSLTRSCFMLTVLAIGFCYYSY